MLPMPMVLRRRCNSNSDSEIEAAASGRREEGRIVLMLDKVIVGIIVNERYYQQ